MVPPHSQIREGLPLPAPGQEDLPPWALAAPPALNAWVRGTMLGVALGWIAVFAIAIWLNPYRDDGQARTMETHRQMGLPPCTFKVISGLPCPSCGMTTSFSLLMHGDLWHSLQANAVGTLLALVGLAYVPWSLASVVWKRPLFIASMEKALIGLVLGFLVLMLARWLIVLGLAWFNGTIQAPGQACPGLPSWRRADDSLHAPLAFARFAAADPGVHGVQSPDHGLLSHRGAGSQVRSGLQAG